MKHIKTENEEFSRDLDSGALINTNINALEEYKARKREREKVSQLEIEVSELRGDISDIKAMLAQLIDR